MVDVQKESVKKECATCSNWLPKRNPAMARQQMAICAIGPSYRFLSPQSTCAQYQPVPADVAQARVKWLET